MRRFLLALLVTMIILITTGPSYATVIPAAGCSQAEIDTAITSAVNGDTVSVPAGPCIWTDVLTITKAITLQGAGIGQTIITDGRVRSDFSGPGNLLDVTVSPTGFFRLTGFEFRADGVQGVAFDGAVILHGCSTTTANYRIDHNKFDGINQGSVLRFYGLYGVVDHNEAISTGNVSNFAHFSNPGWPRDGVTCTGSYGDGSWAYPLPLDAGAGTIRAHYLETNTWTVPAYQTISGLLDGDGGARVVARYNIITNSAIGVHGTETPGRLRSSRWLEVYENTFTFVPSGSPDVAVFIRGGSGVVFNNHVMLNGAFGLNWYVKHQAFRFSDPRTFPPWESSTQHSPNCDGTAPWDGNTGDASGAGYRCLDQPGAGTSVDFSDTAIPPNIAAQNTLEPIYVWGNTIDGVPNNCGSQAYSCNSDGVVVAGRDIIYGTARPSYTPFTYPHPLTVASIPFTPVVFDASAHGGNGGGQPSPYTFPVTLGTGTKGVQVACMRGLFGAGPEITGISVGGSALSLIPNTKASIGSGNTFEAEIWGGLVSVSGFQTVSVTHSGTPLMFCGIVSATGVDLTTPVNNGNYIVDSTSPGTLTIASSPGDLTSTAIVHVGTGNPQSNQIRQWADASIIAMAQDVGPGTANPSHVWSTSGVDWGTNGALIVGANFKAAGAFDTIPPTDPTNAAATSNTSYSIHLTWNPSTDASGTVSYEVYRGDAVCQNWVLIGQPVVPVFDDTGLTASTQYCYRVRASDGVNFSINYTNTAVAMTLAPRTVILSFTDTAPNTQNTEAETGFQWERCAGNPCSNFTALTTVDPNVTALKDTTSPAPVAGYRVSALPLGTGYSNIVYTSPAVPSAILSLTPASLTFSSGVGFNPAPKSFLISSGGGVGMTWTASDNASWVSVSPSSGTDDTNMTVSVDTTGLSAGTHNATITVTAPGASGSPATLAVTLNLSPVTTPSRGKSGRIR